MQALSWNSLPHTTSKLITLYTVCPTNGNWLLLTTDMKTINLPKLDCRHQNITLYTVCPTNGNRLLLTNDMKTINWPKLDWTPKQHGSTKLKKQISIPHLIFHHLSVVLQLEKGDYPENSCAVFRPNKSHSFEPFMCLDLIRPASHYAVT